jgi:hypothetical protein
MLLSFSTQLVDDFRKMTATAGTRTPKTAVSIEVLPAPHRPPSALPTGRMAVYVFTWKGQCLKVGRVDSKSGPRYCTQHYNVDSCNSNLAKSIIAAKREMDLPRVTRENIGIWMKENLDRTNFLLDRQHGVPLLRFFESFLQFRLRPRFEGSKNQT